MWQQCWIETILKSQKCWSNNSKPSPCLLIGWYKLYKPSTYGYHGCFSVVFSNKLSPCLSPEIWIHWVFFFRLLFQVALLGVQDQYKAILLARVLSGWTWRAPRGPKRPWGLGWKWRFTVDGCEILCQLIGEQNPQDSGWVSTILLVMQDFAGPSTVSQQDAGLMGLDGI